MEMRATIEEVMFVWQRLASNKAASGQSNLGAVSSAFAGAIHSPRPVLKMLAGTLKNLVKNHGIMTGLIETSKQ